MGKAQQFPKSDKKVILPGTKLTDIIVFDLSVGDKVYDKDSNREGVIVDIIETGFEVVEAYIRFSGSKAEELAYRYPQAVYLGPKNRN